MSNSIAETFRRISEAKLDDGSALDLIELANLGVPFQILVKLSRDYGINDYEWCQILSISDKSFQRKKQNKQAFSQILSERIIVVQKIYELGTEVFESMEHFQSWMKTENPSLGGIKPRKLLYNIFGMRLLEQELHRISAGHFA